MQRSKVILFPLVLLALLLQGCGYGDQLAEAQGQLAAQAERISELETQVASAGAPGADNERARSNEDIPVVRAYEEAADSNESALGLTSVFVTVSRDTNCRTGPSIDYDLVAIAEAGEPHEVVAIYPLAYYVVIQNPNGVGDCWLWLGYADQTDFRGLGLPEAVPPPPPEPDPEPFDWSGHWNVAIEGELYTMYIYVEGLHFTGEFLDTSGNQVLLIGEFSDNFNTVSGTWVWGGRSSTFIAFARYPERNYFVGQWGPSLGAFCGFQFGVKEPVPCLGP